MKLGWKEAGRPGREDVFPSKALLPRDQVQGTIAVTTVPGLVQPGALRVNQPQPTKMFAKENILLRAQELKYCSHREICLFTFQEKMYKGARKHPALL